MDHNRSLSIDDRRLNFQFGCEIGYEVSQRPSLGRMVRNPTYTGVWPAVLAGRLDMLASTVFFGGRGGLSNCGKGQPFQVGHTGHPAAACPLHSGYGWGCADDALTSEFLEPARDGVLELVASGSALSAADRA